MHAEISRLTITMQDSPQEKFTAQRVGMVWAEFMTTTVIFVTTSKKYGY
jgi:hypothetical protein